MNTHDHNFLLVVEEAGLQTKVIKMHSTHHGQGASFK
jgi:hypothetical protein